MSASVFDRRRINGPEESAAPIFSDDVKSDDSLTVKTGQPRKGRAANEIRPIYLKTGLISQANGSAYIETEKTKIACAVYGPRQSKSTTYNEKGKLNVEVKFAPFSCAVRRAPMRDAEDRSVSVLIQQSLLPAVRLELLPKSSIDIYLFIIESDGIEGCVASGSIAASTALAHAGIDMLGLVVACSAASLPKEIWLDPTADEALQSNGCLTVASVPALGLVTNIWQTGEMDIERVEKCMDSCIEKGVEIHAVVAQALLLNDKLT